jgi:uncharacterized protein YecT (DUF1311 family)
VSIKHGNGLAVVGKGRRLDVFQAVPWKKSCDHRCEDGMKRVLIPVALLCLVSAPLFAYAASFDCANATTPIERKICADPVISAMDEMLAKVYSQTLKGVGDCNDLAGSQEAWLIRRNGCKDTGCVQRAYEDRISELSCQDTGGAAGAMLCHGSQLQLADYVLAPLEKQYAQIVTKASDNPSSSSLLLAEARLWRQYRAARCALHGETEGGSDEWKSAWAAGCEVDQTRERIAALRGQLGEK